MKISETFRKPAFLAVLLAVSAALYSLTPIHNGNFFWHLRNGLDILDTGGIRTADPFTWTMNGSTWIQQEWLAEVAMAAAWTWGGSAGPVILKAMLIGLSVFFAFKAALKNGADPSLAFIFGAAWLALAQPRWIARPHVFSIFFFSVYLYILSFRVEKPLKLAAFLFPLQVLWVNVHSGFVMGIFLAAVPAMDRLLHLRWKASVRWTAVPLILLLASGIHPNGFRTLEYLPAFLSMPLYKETIREWWSPFDPRYAPLRPISRTALLLIGLTAATGALISFFGKALERGRIAALALLAAATVFAARNGELLAPAMLSWVPGMTRIRLPRLAMVLPAVLILAVPFLYGIPREVGPPRQLGTGVDWSVYPVAAADILEAHPALLEKAVLFNSNEISGYLEYRFGESLPLFMDGRCLIFPEDFYREYLSLCFPMVPDFRKEQYDLFLKYGFNLLIYSVPEEGSSVYLAAALPEWEPLYVDGLVSVYAKKTLLEESGSEDLGFSCFDPYDPVEFMARPYYLVPSRALEELRLQREQMGTGVLDRHIAALEFRNGAEADWYPFPGDDRSGQILNCWRNCREGDLDRAAENAALSGDPQLATAVRILQGGTLGEEEDLLGIRSSGMVRTPGALLAVKISALWVTGQQSLALETAGMYIDSLPGWGVAQCGLLYSLAGRGGEALALADRALEIRQGPVVLERVARIHFILGDFAAAAEYCREALALSPGFSGARLLLGDCLWNMNMASEGGMEYEMVALSGLDIPEYCRLRLELLESLDMMSR